MARERTYSDDQLTRAVADSNSWRALLRKLGLAASSSGAMKSVRLHADRLGLDYSHFRWQSRWSEDRLRAAVAGAATWPQVMVFLGLDGGDDIATVKGHAARLNLDVTHLAGPLATTTERPPRPDVVHLRRAGSLLAAAWFSLCGRDVSWPLEPCRYDLIVCDKNETQRVQVKTTTTRAGNAWKVYLSTSRRQRRTYDPDDIDAFFIIDGDFTYYLIPFDAVGGLHAIHLSAYDRYRVGRMP